MLSEIAMNELPLAVPGSKLAASAHSIPSVTSLDMAPPPPAPDGPAAGYRASGAPAALELRAGEVLGKHKWRETLEGAMVATSRGRGAALAPGTPLRKIVAAQQAQQAQAAVLAPASFLVGTAACVLGAAVAAASLWVAAGKPGYRQAVDRVAEKNVARRDRLQAGAVGATTTAISAAAETAVLESSVATWRRRFGGSLAARPRAEGWEATRSSWALAPRERGRGKRAAPLVHSCATPPPAPGQPVSRVHSHFSLSWVCRAPAR